MNRLRILFGVVALSLCASQVHAVTPTPIASASQTPAAAATPLNVVKKIVGTSANFLKFFGAGSCTVDPAAIGECGSAVYTCAVPGAQTTDAALVQAVMPNAVASIASLSRDCFYVQGAAVTAADVVSFRVINRECGAIVSSCDPPATSFNYIVLRPNADAD